MLTLGQIRSVVLHPSHLKRTSLIALAVGTWLSLLNVGEQLLMGPWNLPLVTKIALNLLTPFVVANFGLLSRQQWTDSDIGK